MRIVAYTLNADTVCPDCLHDMMALSDGVSRSFPMSTQSDEHSVPLDLVDRDGNAVRPVFSTDEVDAGTCCGECHTPLAQ
jgi:hypothetical protein